MKILHTKIARYIQEKYLSIKQSRLESKEHGMEKAEEIYEESKSNSCCSEYTNDDSQEEFEKQGSTFPEKRKDVSDHRSLRNEMKSIPLSAPSSSFSITYTQ